MRRKIFVAVQITAFLVSVLFLVSCTSKPVSLSEVPVYTGAVEQTADKGIGATLAKNNQIDAAMRNAVGVGGKTEQKGYVLPKETTWAQVKDFYDSKLKSSGWAAGGGGKAGNIANDVMNVVNQNNPMMQTAIWAKGKQNLTVMLVTNPVNKTEKNLILSLSTN